MMLKFSNEALKNSMVILGPGQTTVVKGEIYDDITGKTHEAAVVFGPLGIEVRLDGYGEGTANDGEGCVVFVEVINGKAKANVYADIEVQGPTQQIDLSKASEKRRFEVGDRVRTIAVGRPCLTGEITAINLELRPYPMYNVSESSAHYDGHEGWFSADEMEHSQ